MTVQPEEELAALCLFNGCPWSGKVGVGTLKSPDMQELHFQELKKKSFAPPENLYVFFKRLH